jgi:hypothetical protein
MKFSGSDASAAKVRTRADNTQSARSRPRSFHLTTVLPKPVRCGVSLDPITCDADGNGVNASLSLDNVSVQPARSTHHGQRAGWHCLCRPRAQHGEEYGRCATQVRHAGNTRTISRPGGTWLPLPDRKGVVHGHPSIVPQGPK